MSQARTQPQPRWTLLVTPIAAILSAATLAACSAETTIQTPRILAAATVIETFDRITLGDPQSEKQHQLTASPPSGTNQEVGRSRRFTGTAPGGFFEFTLSVRRAEPATIRILETFDTPRRRRGRIFIGDRILLVHTTTHTTPNPGIEIYEFEIPASLIDRPTIRMRIQSAADNTYSDPSIAMVWSHAVVD